MNDCRFCHGRPVGNAATWLDGVPRPPAPCPRCGETNWPELDPREYDLARLRQESADLGDCPNGPDEDGNWPCDPKGYFGVAECQVCGRVGAWNATKGLRQF